MKIGCICFLRRGEETALKIRAALQKGAAGAEKNAVSLFSERQGLSDASFQVLPGSVRDFASEAFSLFSVLIFVGPAGSAVRAIGPLLSSRETDPAIFVVDERGRFVIPLIRGRVEAAGDLSRTLAEGIGAELVSTSGGDFGCSFEVEAFARKNGFVLLDRALSEEVSDALSDARPVGIRFDENFQVSGEVPAGLTLLDPSAPPLSQAEAGDRPKIGISVSYRTECACFERNLYLIPRNLVLGIGLRPDRSWEELFPFVRKFLGAHGISHLALKKICGLESVLHREAFSELSRKLGVPYESFTHAQLVRVPGHFSPALYVERQIGIDNIAERSAVLGAMKGNLPGRLLIAKTGQGGLTAALAAEETVISF